MALLENNTFDYSNMLEIRFFFYGYKYPILQITMWFGIALGWTQKSKGHNGEDFKVPSITPDQSDVTRKNYKKCFCFIFAILAILHHLETIFQFLFFSLVTVTRSNKQMVAFLNSNFT